MRSRHFKSGYTLIEMVLSSVILCIAVLSISAVSTRPLKAARLNRQYETALQLADRQLTLIDYIGGDFFSEAKSAEGQFEQDGINYIWELETEYLGMDNLYSVRITTKWVSDNKPYSIEIETRFNTAIAEAEEEL